MTTSLVKRKTDEAHAPEKKIKLEHAPPISMPSSPPIKGDMVNEAVATNLIGGLSLVTYRNFLSTEMRDAFWKSSSAHSVRNQRDVAFGGKTSYLQTFFADRAVMVSNRAQTTVATPPHVLRLEEIIKTKSDVHLNHNREYVVENYLSPQLAHGGNLSEIGKHERRDVCALVFFSLGQTRYLQIHAHNDKNWTNIEMPDNSVMILKCANLFEHYEYRLKQLSPNEEAGVHMHVLFRYLSHAE